MKEKKLNDFELNELRKIWYKKLQENGFRDIEIFEYPDGMLLSENIHLIRDAHAKAEYFSLAGQFLHENKFESELHKDIWKLHSEGISIRKIAKIKGMSQTPVFNILKTIKKVFKKFVKKEQETDSEPYGF